MTELQKEFITRLLCWIVGSFVGAQIAGLNLFESLGIVLLVVIIGICLRSLDLWWKSQSL